MPYMATGSIVSSIQGEPRASHDIDFVVDISPEAARRLLEAFPPPQFYLDPVAVRDAVKRRDMFNLVEPSTGEKVDFWPVKDEPYDVERFSRRYVEDVQDILGVELFVSRPEDTILQKLRWAEMSGGSERQFGDALRVFELQRETLDVEYMSRWVTRLGLQALWQRLQHEARPL
ncbi:MAG TPA: hypothetical protein VFB66_07970 [Tepidisphaeraceae bacterium]|nr:hypothetical protein [Tepidisphaeraceae bacterium]